jgi:hypothetical protein
METTLINEMYAHPEKRGNPRIDLEVQVRISRPLSHFMVHGWMQDISDGGFKIRAYAPLTPRAALIEGDEIYFETFEEFFCFKGKGEVKWTSSDGSFAGVKFDKLDDESRHFLESFLLCSKETWASPADPSSAAGDLPSQDLIQDPGGKGCGLHGTDLRRNP